ncbi:hypothetical protein XENOCAPTIV_016691 [Xenoophorus captivus]|uniref:Uncharacterized protein n=1 Tax=Xenoophorus captivus TaxID=1517983 RepID=A0ABV0RKY1_9TELE
MFSMSPAMQQGSKCILHDKEDVSRLELVQRLAKDGCRFLQNHSKGPEMTTEEHDFVQIREVMFIKRTSVVVLTQHPFDLCCIPVIGSGGLISDEAVRFCVRERGHDVLVLRRVLSDQSAQSAWMGSCPQPLNLQEENGLPLLLAALVEQEEDEEGSEESSSTGTSLAEPQTMPTFDVPYFRYIDDEGTEGEEEWSSSRSLSSVGRDSSADSVVSDRYMVVSGTPEKILEHLLNDTTLEDDRGTTQGKESGQHPYFNTLPLFFKLCFVRVWKGILISITEC